MSFIDERAMSFVDALFDAPPSILPTEFEEFAHRVAKIGYFRNVVQRMQHVTTRDDNWLNYLQDNLEHDIMLGSDVNQISQWTGKTALQYLAVIMANEPERAYAVQYYVHLLIQNKANVSIRDHSSYTAYDIANMYSPRHAQLMDILREATYSDDVD